MSAAPARRPLTRRALAAAVTALVVAIVMLSMETAYAVWQDQTSTDAGTVATGTAELTAEWSGEDDSSSWQNLIPGESVTRDITVTNLGDVPVALHAALLTSSEGLELSMTEGSEGSPSGPALSAAHTPLQANGAPLVLEPGETTSIQAMLTVTPEVAPEQRFELKIELEGRQVA